MDNRHGLLTDVALTVSDRVTEPQAALGLLARQQGQHWQLRSVGGDKGFQTRHFVTELHRQRTAAHVDFMAARNVGLSDGVLESAGYRAGQIVRERIEHNWGRDQTVGGLRNTRLRGTRHNGEMRALNGATCNLLRIKSIVPGYRMGVCALTESGWHTTLLATHASRHTPSTPRVRKYVLPNRVSRSAR
jgi:hypothetical protein